MDLTQKINLLKTQENLALYKWTASGVRVAGGDYILLSDLRLSSICILGGRVVLSVAAPVLYMLHGRPRITYETKNVVTIGTGPRKGINTKLEFLAHDEEATPAKACLCVELTQNKEYPKWIEKRVLSLACSARYPSAKILTPDLLRMSRHPENFRPIWSKALIEAIGGRPGDSLESLQRLFTEMLPTLGTDTGEGYVIPAEYIATGGCCVVPARGISVRSGSLVHMMPCLKFLAECKQHGWHLLDEETR